jgi:subtilisin family serine protease
MKPVLRLFVGLSLCVFAWFAVAAGQEPQPQQLGYVPDEVLVRFRPQAVSALRDAIVRGAGGQVLRRFEELNLHRVRLAPGTSVRSAIAALRLQNDVVSAEPNFIRQIVLSANDPYWSDGTLWGLKKIQADAAWNLSTGSATVVVADLDTGINYNHPDLAANVWRNPGEIAGNGVDDDHNGYVDDVFGIDTANNDRDPMDDHGHGTHTAGTIGAVGNNGIGVVGVNWNVKILPCKFLRADGSGTDAAAIECFNYIVALKNKGVNIRVSSNSWGSPRDLTAPFPYALKSAIDAAADVGILNVFAAGNIGTDNDVTPFDPASFDSAGIMSVAASDSSDQRASWSNYGVTSVDLAAPGVSIVSTVGATYGPSSGTSMAAPHVAGAAALLSAFNSTLTATGIKTLLMNNVDKLSQWSGVVASGGRLNVFLPMVAASGDILPTVSITRPTAGSTFTAPASITVEASASDADGSVTKVDFYANGAPIGTDTTSPYSIAWANVAAGNYQLTAVATDNLSFTATSESVAITVSPAANNRVNVALAANGATATASSSYASATAQPSSAINGDRMGAGYAFWSDTGGTFPDWLRVDFSGAKAIDEVDLFMVQDNFTAPSPPTSTMTFNSYGLTNFSVEYWTGSAWAPVPGAAVSGNRLVWRQFTFAPVTTAAIRVFITGSIDGWSRLTEVEAYSGEAAFKFPSDNWWYLDISNAPIDPSSASYIAFINNGSARKLHPDFGGPYGIPYIVADSTVPKKAVHFGYSSESDGVDHTTDQSFPFYPIPDNAITQPYMIEGVEPGNVDLRSVNDRHLLVVDKDKRHLYELWNVFYDGTRWLAGSGAFFDMNTNNRRTEGWTSADAAGLAILPGLIRYEEAFGTGEIRHAFRVTVRATNGYVYPASHRAGSTTGSLPMGARLRLKASKNLSGFSPEVQRIFRAMQRYGLIVADNGADMFISGTYDSGWNNDVLNPSFGALTANDFEVISLGYR